jgi:hypothetical protein
MLLAFQINLAISGHDPLHGGGSNPELAVNAVKWRNLPFL